MYDAQRRAEKPNSGGSRCHGQPEACQQPREGNAPQCGCESAPPPKAPPCPERCHDQCAESCPAPGGECCAASASPAQRLPSEELLILALLVLVMNEGGSLPLVLALLWLLM